MKKAVLSALSMGLAACLISPAAAAEESPGLWAKPARNGFTLELGAGAGLANAASSDGSFFAVSPFALSLSLGWYLRDDNVTSLSLRFLMTGYRHDGGGAAGDGYGGFMLLGVYYQRWLNDWFFVGGGPGLVEYGRSVERSGSGNTYTTYSSTGGSTSTTDGGGGGFENAALGIGVRTGASFLWWENHALVVSLEVIPAFSGGGVIISETLKVEWMWY